MQQSLPKAAEVIPVLICIALGLAMSIALRRIAERCGPNMQAQQKLILRTSNLALIGTLVITGAWIIICFQPQFFWIIPALVGVAALLFIVLTVKSARRSA
jgi:hypothetical protein